MGARSWPEGWDCLDPGRQYQEPGPQDPGVPRHRYLRWSRREGFSGEGVLPGGRRGPSYSHLGEAVVPAHPGRRFFQAVSGEVLGWSVWGRGSRLHLAYPGRGWRFLGEGEDLDFVGGDSRLCVFWGPRCSHLEDVVALVHPDMVGGVLFKGRGSRLRLLEGGFPTSRMRRPLHTLARSSQERGSLFGGWVLSCLGCLGEGVLDSVRSSKLPPLWGPLRTPAWSGVGFSFFRRDGF